MVNFKAKSSLRGRCPKTLDECATSTYNIKSLKGAQFAKVKVRRLFSLDKYFTSYSKPDQVG